ncbi:Rieske (2Fe-2S) protein [Waterburya agarophytonicola K14]|uniref:Rieske (2Fe-2S) protein n=1 Tax=Waterburya agarophytonicola KI4 TaxID=2874699 RepID=A0A964BPI9_9CYAN|nr:Rieske (2Fe-2S) protein [Waterburya agarophytonicola]MCC0176497.1 Rieske (2Fe-2S) protein [Waterburya agarophytonicola KI4]
MTWTTALAVDDLAPGTRQVVKLAERSLLLLNESGKIHAVNSVCPHLKLSLKKGKINSDGALVCPWHRSEFDLETGSVNKWCPFPPVLGNVLGKISSENNLAVFPTKVENGQILVDLSV